MKPTLIGLTGGIGTCKTVVTKMFEAEGFPVLNADQISREVMQPGKPAFKEIIQLFGSEVETPQGLDRRKIRDKIFQNPTLRKQLEKITHPKIMERAFELASQCAKEGKPIVILEAAVLIEAQLTHLVDCLILVTATEEQQRERAAKRDDVSAIEIEAIIKAQLSQSERKKHARYLIDNSGPLQETERQVKEVAKKIRKDFQPLTRNFC